MPSTKTERRVRLRARITEFAYPPVHDGLVLGRSAPLGLEAVQRALSLLVTTPFEHLPIQDEVISDVLVRSGVLRRVPPAKVIEFILTHVKPLMSGEEVLHLDLSTEIEVDVEGL